MKHARADYQRLQDPAGKIPDGEPVFLIRGQDVIAPAVLKFYADMAERNGVDPELVRAVRNQALAMETWPRKKRPDLPGDMRAEVERLNTLMPDHVLVINEAYKGGPLAEGELPQGATVTEAPKDRSGTDVELPLGRLTPEPRTPTGEPIVPIDSTDPEAFRKMLNKDKR